MKTVAILTSHYPFYPGEQFIEDEIGYWGVQTAVKVMLVPLTAAGEPRNVPNGIKINLMLSKTSKTLHKILWLVPAFFSTVFWKELSFVFSSQGANVKCIWRALLCVSRVLRIENALAKICKKDGSIDAMYCYWNEVQAYAAVRLKQRGIISRVVSRAHGYDVYQDRRDNGYMPLKRQFINGMSSIMAISIQGKKYLVGTYHTLPKLVSIHRLGVPIPRVSSSASTPACLNIVSVSFCIAGKRIDKIIDAIALVALNRKEIDINWTHIGGGPLLADLNKHAESRFKGGRVNYRLVGNLPNCDVKKYYEFNHVDMFVNTSESEGVPVSIMEAMSYGVPVIAPDIGGISELVSNQNGRLLSENPDVLEVFNAMLCLFSICKNVEFRAHAKTMVCQEYNAGKNYQALISAVVV